VNSSKALPRTNTGMEIWTRCVRRTGAT